MAEEESKISNQAEKDAKKPNQPEKEIKKPTQEAKGEDSETEDLKNVAGAKKKKKKKPTGDINNIEFPDFPKPSTPKFSFNFYWVYLIIAIAFLAVTAINWGSAP